VLARASSLLAS